MSRLSWRQWRLNLRRSAGEESICWKQLVFAPKMRWLQKFSGKPGHGVSVYEFIEVMTRISKTRPTSQEEQVDFVLSHLEGPAMEEMRFRSIEEKRSSKAVLGILKEIFGGKSDRFWTTPSSKAQSIHVVNPSKTSLLNWWESWTEFLEWTVQAWKKETLCW